MNQKSWLRHNDMSLVIGPSWCQVTGTDEAVGVGPTGRPIMHGFVRPWKRRMVKSTSNWKTCGTDIHVVPNPWPKRRRGIISFFSRVFYFNKRGWNGKREIGPLTESKRWYHLWCENPMKSQCQYAIILVADVIIWLFRMRGDSLSLSTPFCVFLITIIFF